MVVFSTTLSILSGVFTTPRVRTNRTDSTATFPPPHVGRSRGLRSEKLCKKKVQACAGAAKPAIGGTPHQASCFSLLGPDAGAARDTDKCETHARTHSAPHDERRVQRTIHLTTATACWPAPLRGGSAALPLGSYLVDPASSHMLVSKIKPCMSKYKYCTAKLQTAH